MDLDVHLAAIAGGDSQAFADWMSRAEDPLRRALRPFAGQVDVESVLQEGLLRVWQIAPRVETDGKGNSLLRLAHRICRNLALSECRRRRAAPIGPLLLAAGRSEQEQFEPRPPDPLLRRMIGLCRDKLPAKPAAALTARLRAAGKERDAILAEGLGWKTNTFLQNFGRARRLLAECLQKHGVDLQAELA